jgi:signal peptide peptidase SppA
MPDKTDREKAAEEAAAAEKAPGHTERRHLDRRGQYPLARNYMASRVWAIRSDTLHVMGELLRMRSQGIALTAEEIQARIGAPRRAANAMAGAVAVIPLVGVIDQKVGSMTDISGGTSIDGFMKSMRQCVQDPGVSAIVIDADTPGGSVDGVPEAAAEILSMRGTKPIVAVADTCIASAGYYLCCAADEIVCMPSGQVGSLGVVGVHDDYSKQNEMLGYTPTYIFFGAYKVEMNSDSPLDPDALAYQQGQIDAIGNDFLRFVAKARNLPVDTIRSGFGQGRMMLAKDALAAKMIDRIDTLDATIQRVGRMAKASGVGAHASTAQAERDELDNDLDRLSRR